MLALIFTLPFAAALLCLALNRVVSTRWLGIEAAGVLLLAVGALRASGTMAGSDILPVGLLAGLIGALLLLAAALTSNTPASPAALACWTLVGLLAFGGPLFHALLDAPAEAPAALAGVLIPLGL